MHYGIGLCGPGTLCKTVTALITKGTEMLRRRRRAGQICSGMSLLAYAPLLTFKFSQDLATPSPTAPSLRQYLICKLLKRR